MGVNSNEVSEEMNSNMAGRPGKKSLIFFRYSQRDVR